MQKGNNDFLIINKFRLELHLILEYVIIIIIIIKEFKESMLLCTVIIIIAIDKIISFFPIIGALLEIKRQV
jgi:hypothetical protein